MRLPRQEHGSENALHQSVARGNPGTKTALKGSIRLVMQEMRGDKIVRLASRAP